MNMWWRLGIITLIYNVKIPSVVGFGLLPPPCRLGPKLTCKTSFTSLRSSWRLEDESDDVSNRKRAPGPWETAVNSQQLSSEEKSSELRDGIEDSLIQDAFREADKWDEEDVDNTSIIEYGLDDIDFETMELELAKAEAVSSSAVINSMSLGPAGRELDDVLMEKSLRFYDPKITGEREKAFLVGLETRGYGKSGPDKGAPEPDTEEALEAARQRRKDWDNRFTLEESLGELCELAGTAGLEVCGTTYQRVVEPNPRTYIGTGKVREVRRAMREMDCKTVIIDHELSPGQQRSLEAEFGGEEEGIKVLDRTALILDIFAQHARTREGQLQVELALHLYRLPRLTKLWTHLERQSGAAGAGGGKSGGVGLRGPGERQLEVDRRLLKTKITDLQRELGGVRRHRSLHRKRREALGLPVVALVGYTNSGKSTLLNSLTSAGVLAEDMLFATLDPTTRRVKLPGLKVHPEVMLTDTVGFIQKLPTNLVAAFRGTLEEVAEADVIVHVCDRSNPAWAKQHRAVLKVLEELGALEGDNGIKTPVVTLWNKLDLVPENEKEDIRIEAETAQEPTCTASARTGEGMDDFIRSLEAALSQLLSPVEALIPFSAGGLLSRIHELGACDVEEYEEGGCFVQARVPDELYNRLEPYFTENFVKQVRRRRDLIASKDPALASAMQGEEDWAKIAKKRHKIATL